MAFATVVARGIELAEDARTDRATSMTENHRQQLIIAPPTRRSSRVQAGAARSACVKTSQETRRK